MSLPMHGAPQRVWMTTDTVGGVWTFSLELAGALSESGIEVGLAALGGIPSPSQRREALRVPGLTLFESAYKLEWMENPWDDVRASGEWLLDLAAKYRPDIVHLNTFGHATLPWTAPVVLTAHSCVASWWRDCKASEPPREWDRYRAAVMASLEAADAVTAPSKAMADALAACYGFDRTKVHVIANGRSGDRFRTTAKEELILPAGRLWDEEKNIAALCHLASDLPWPVCIAGRRDEPGAGRKAEFPGCRWLGLLPADELAGWYARAAIYALPARHEPFGYSAVEAALCGCALVLGDIASLREVWGGAALFVPPDDAEALRRTLLGLIEHSRRRRELARKAEARARQFTPHAMAAQYQLVYASVTERKLACAS